jgi:DNA polymerase family A
MARNLLDVVLDFETYYDSEYSLSKMTTRAYILDPRFEALVISVRFLKTKQQLVAVGDAQIRRLLAKLNWAGVNAIAHNGAFDHSILSWIYDIHPAKLSCTLAMSLPFHASTVGGSLANLARVYNLPDKGTAVHNMLGKHLQDMTAQEVKEYAQYCGHDSFLCGALYEIFIAKLPRTYELSVIDATLRMYTDPVLRIDTGVIEPHLQALIEEKEDTLQELISMLRTYSILPLDVIDSETMQKHCASAPKFCQLLKTIGVEPPMKWNKKNTKQIPALAKTDPGMEDLLASEDPVVVMLAEARMATKSTLPTTRAKRFLELALMGGMPFPLKYYGAEQTGRWSAWDSINLQNLPRTSPLRDSLTAPVGYGIVAGDESQVELRTGLELAGQLDRLDLLRCGHDLYKQSVVDSLGISYGDVSKDQRQMGKVTQLSAIFGVSAPVVRRTIWLMGRVRVDGPTSERLVATYRATHPKVVAAWADGNLALQMIANGQTGTIWGGRCTVTPEGIRKPSGLFVRYPNLRQQMGDKGRPEWVYDKKLGKVTVPTKIYGAKVFQNCVQSIARDIMAVVVSRVNNVRLQPPYLHPAGIIHDELIGIAPLEYVDQAARLLHKALTTPVSFSANIPLDCEIETGLAYGLCEKWKP